VTDPSAATAIQEPQVTIVALDESGASSPGPGVRATADRARSHRARRVRAAVASGAGAKTLGIAVQLISVGIAARSLRPEALGSYLVIASLVGWLGLAAVGVGPGLTRKIAVLAAAGDRRGQAMAFSSSLSLAAVFLLAAGAAVVLLARPVIGNAGHSVSDGDIQTAVAILGLATGLQVWLSVLEAAQLGHLEQHFTNVFQGLGQIGVLVILVAAGPALVTVTAFVIATAIPPLVAKAINAIVYVWRHAYLVTNEVSFRQAGGVLSTSLAFAAVSLGSLASQQFGFLLLAATSGAQSAVPLGVMLRLTYAAFGLVSLVTQPLWPAMADAVARDDAVWARRIYRRVSLGALAYSCTFAAGLAAFGGMGIRAWAGPQVAIQPPMLVLFGLYFIALVWAHVNAITLVGLGRVWAAGGVFLLEAAVSVLGALLLVPSLGELGAVISLLLATSLVSCVLLPRLVGGSWQSLGLKVSQGLVARLRDRRP
jgi:O-antigen/teichoic acid export membrane protein